MLCVFDEAALSKGSLTLSIDAVASLARQWILRIGILEASPRYCWRLPSGYGRRSDRALAADRGRCLFEQIPSDSCGHYDVARFGPVV